MYYKPPAPPPQVKPLLQAEEERVHRSGEFRRKTVKSQTAPALALSADIEKEGFGPAVKSQAFQEVDIRQFVNFYGLRVQRREELFRMVDRMVGSRFQKKAESKTSIGKFL